MVARDSVEWKEFERDTRRLLHLMGWSVTPEKVLGHKKVDSYAEKRDQFGRLEKLALECKCEADALHKAGVSKIYADYLPLIQDRKINTLLLVTKVPAAPSALTYCESATGFVVMTKAQLLNSLIDFSSYLAGLLASDPERVQEYYTSQTGRFEGGAVVAENFLLEWASGKDKRPVALLAGYGMGKTTLARRVAKRLAENHREDPEERIPILINLEDISVEQSLAGLVAKKFTARSPVPGFNFDTFMALNERGRFVVLLDGFDEMKQVMSWSAMQYNFSQLNQLISGESRVLLLGRPTAFLSEDEYRGAIRGERQFKGEWTRIPNAPRFSELELDFFTKDQIRKFVPRYIAVHGEGEDLEAETVLSELESGELLHIVGRPVQLRMLLEVFPALDIPLQSVTVTGLYTAFIDMIIEREQRKLARQGKTKEQRRDFARNIAWWMWLQGVGASIDAGKIPEHMIQPYVDVGEDLEDVKRDLLRACCLASQPPSSMVYFPHRSFQEFLVAEHIDSICRAGVLCNDRLILNQEILDFFDHLTPKSETNPLKTALYSHRGTVQHWLVQVIDLKHVEVKELLDDLQYKKTPWALAILGLKVLNSEWDGLGGEGTRGMVQLLKRAPEFDKSHQRDWASLSIVLCVLLRDWLESFAGEVLGEVIAALLKHSGQQHRFKDDWVRRVSLGRIVNEHLTPDFCMIEPMFSEAAKLTASVQLRRPAPLSSKGGLGPDSGTSARGRRTKATKPTDSGKRKRRPGRPYWHKN